jgi:hypothetical protein
VLLAGLTVPDRLVLDLARCLRLQGLNDTAETLEDAHDDGREMVALTIADREAILHALADCPYGLADLRGVLLLEHEWRVTAGLVSHAAPVG